MNDAPQKDPAKLFVGNLPWSMSQDDITKVFAEYGELEDVYLVTERHTGRSRGIAFVKYAGEDGEKNAAAAMEAQDGKEHDGREIRVNIAEPRKPRNDRGNNRGGSRGGDRGGYNRGGNSRY